ncbi:hypothetical protein, partial [Zymomonas mobilis]|uniref:hypothetical protein n=1 Tax=Zymomonas mobilis TaxID=542 RepID=UPI0039E8C126
MLQVHRIAYVFITSVRVFKLGKTSDYVWADLLNIVSQRLICLGMGFVAEILARDSMFEASLL